MSISGVSSNNSNATTSTSSASNAATNVGPISFPGITSGIDYSAIITKLTNITAAQQAPLKAKAAKLTDQDTELNALRGLFQNLQGSLKNLSSATTFNSFKATSSDETKITATQTAGQIVSPGVYTIANAKVGTATQVRSVNAGHKLSDNLNGVPSNTIALSNSYVQIPPSNGAAANGTITINGVKVNYDVSTQSLDQILANIQSQVQAGTGDATFTASYNAATDKVTIASTAKPVTIGATNDSGNLAQVLKLDVAQINNTPTTGSVTSAFGVGGVNQFLNLNSTNGAGDATNGNFVTPVTAGTFSINGVSFNVSPSTQALSDIIKQINNSSAGVVANFNSGTGQINLANKSSGASSIVIGSSNDTSNFLTATGLITSGLGTPTTTIGTQSQLTVTDTAGVTSTVYTNGNEVTNAIPGLTINIAADQGATPITINVAQTSTTATTAINTFVTAYNNVVNELNTATAAPVVTQKTTATGVTANAVGGGVLYGNNQVVAIKNQLVALVSSLQKSGSTSYNSLSNIGLKLSDSFTVLSASGTGNGSAGIGTQTFQGTDGSFQALDTSTFDAAFAADPNAVANIFTGASNFVNQLGTYLTQVTGTATQVSSGLAGVAPATSTLAAITNSNQSIIDQTNRAIARLQAQVTAQANLLTTQFNASELQLAKIQSQQSYLSQLGTGA